MALPNSTSGFTGNEIVTRVIKYIGNTSDDFQSYVENSLTLAQFRFCQMHDWSFLRKAGLELTVTNGTSEYELSEANLGSGNQLSPANVESIFEKTKGVFLRQIDINDMRRLDPEENDGSDSDTPTMWAQISDRTIKLWPPTFESTTLVIDGKIDPPAVTLGDFITIPYRYQESFIAYVIAMALDRENDNRASAAKTEAIQLIKQDINDDRRQLGQTMQPRFKSQREAQYDGAGSGLDARIAGYFFWYGDY